MVFKVVPKQADRPSNELQTAMSALENAISMLGTVTATTRPHAAGMGPADREWTAREDGKTGNGSRWRSRTQKTGDASSADLSNTLSLLDSTIVAIDSAISPSSSNFTTSSTQKRDRLPFADFATDFNRSDVIKLTSGLRPAAEMYPWRFDSGITTSGGNSSWRGQEWSRRTQLDKLQREDNVKLELRQPGIVITATVFLFCKY